MSIPPTQIQVLRTVFQTCRPRVYLRPRYRTVPLACTTRQVRTHSNNSSTQFTPPHSSSVSQDEVSHFSRLASSWWDPHGPSRLLHLMNPLRHDFIATCLQSDPSYDPRATKTYLDIGCGGGIFASSAARKPHTTSVTAIDPTPEVIAVAKSQQRNDPAIAEPKLRYLNCAIEDLDSATQPEGAKAGTPHQQYDIISLFEVIEHIDTPSNFLDIALKHLKPNGWLVGSTISRHPISYITTKLIAEAPVIGVVPSGTHDWNKYINPGEIRAWFDKQTVAVQSKEATKGPTTAETETPASPALGPAFGPVRIEGVVYVPFLGWKFVKGSEAVGNYFFGVQKLG